MASYTSLGCWWRRRRLLLLMLGVHYASAMPALLLQPSSSRFKAKHPDDWDIRVLPALWDRVTWEQVQGGSAVYLSIRDGVKPELSRRTWAAMEYTTNIAPGEAAPSDMCTEGEVQRASRRVRLSAKVYVQGLPEGFGWAGLYLGVLDARGYDIGLDNMHDRPILNSVAGYARRYEVVMNVPPNAASLEYGLHLVGGTGSATMTHLALQWVSQDVPLTTRLGVPPLDKFVPPDFGNPGYGIPK